MDDTSERELRKLVAKWPHDKIQDVGHSLPCAECGKAHDKGRHIRYGPHTETPGMHYYEAPLVHSKDCRTCELERLLARTVQEQPPFDVEAVVSANEREIKARSCQICGRELPGARSFSVCNGKCVETANKLSRLQAEAAEAYRAGQIEMRERATWNSKTPVHPGNGSYQLGFLHGQNSAQDAVRALPLTGPELTGATSAAKEK